MSEEKTLDISTQGSLDQAFKQGVRVIIPKDRQLQIDIDSDDDYSRFTQAYDALKQHYLNVPLYYKTSPSRNGGEGRHITVEMTEELAQIERIALQAILGSDWRRELFSLIRVRKGEPLPTLFFEKE